MPTYGKDFEQIYTEVQRNCGDTTTGFLADIKRAINDAGRSLFNRMAYSWKQRTVDLTLVASQAYLNMSDVASDWDDLTPVTIYYRDSANQRMVLDPLDDEEFDIEEDLDEGDPVAYHITKVSGVWRIYFTPVPDSGFVSDYNPLKMEYTKKWTELSATTDIPDIPTSHHQLLTYRSNELVSIIMGDTESAIAWKSEADKEIGLLNKKQVGRLGRPHRVRPREYIVRGRGRPFRDYNKG